MNVDSEVVAVVPAFRSAYGCCRSRPRTGRTTEPAIHVRVSVRTNLMATSIGRPSRLESCLRRPAARAGSTYHSPRIGLAVSRRVVSVQHLGIEVERSRPLNSPKAGFDPGLSEQVRIGVDLGEHAAPRQRRTHIHVVDASVREPESKPVRLERLDFGDPDHVSGQGLDGHQRFRSTCALPVRHQLRAMHGLPFSHQPKSAPRGALPPAPSLFRSRS